MTETIKTGTLTGGHIRNTTDIRHRIMQLKAQQAEEELMLKRDIRELQYSFRFSTLIKDTFRDLKEDKEFRSDAISGTLGLGANFVLDNIMLRKGSGIKKYLLNTGLKKAVSFFLAGSKLKNIFSRSGS